VGDAEHRAGGMAKRRLTIAMPKTLIAAAGTTVIGARRHQ